jgi:molybdate transport system substrate-binding protein
MRKPPAGRATRALTLRALGFALALGLGVAPDLGYSGAAGAEEITVFAAASTKDAVEEIAEAYAAAGGGEVRTVFAASSTLAKQIAQGAPADLYLSANPAWMDYLAERGAVDAASRVDLLGNRLVLIVPQETEDGDAATADLGDLSAAALADLLDTSLADGRRLAIADPGHVPAGIYARAALEALGLWQSLADRTVRAANVRAALALVDRGEAPVGIVYATDARISSRVRVVGGFPPESHPPIVYPLALVAGPAAGAARRFYDHLRSEAAAVVFRAHGFLVPPGPAS